MSTSPALARVVRLLNGRRDQRAHRRYPISLPVDYKLRSKGRINHTGSGESLPAGGSIELVMNWPFLLEGVCPLKLVMRGRIVRSDGERIAIQAQQHEFRTAGTLVPRVSAAVHHGPSKAK